MAKVMKECKSYKKVRISYIITLLVSLPLVVIPLFIRSDWRITELDTLVVSVIIGALGITAGTVLWAFYFVYGGAVKKLNRALLSLDDDTYVYYDYSVPGYPDSKVHVLVVLRSGAYCIELNKYMIGSVDGDDKRDRWRILTYRQIVYIDNPFIKLREKIKMINDYMSSRGILIDITPILVFQDKMNLNDVNSILPVMKLSYVPGFIASNKREMNINPEHIASVL